MPGAPAVQPTHSSYANAEHKPITVALDAGTKLRIKITCWDTSTTPKAVNITAYNVTNTGGALYQSIEGKSSSLGGSITSYPTELTYSPYVMYVAPSKAAVDYFNYTVSCSSHTEYGQVYIVVASAPVADSAIAQTVVADSSMTMFLAGTNEIAALLQPEIVSLPTKGTLYQLNFSDPTSLTSANKITTVPTAVTNPLYGLVYVPTTKSASGSDAVGFKMYHGGIASSTVSMSIEIQSWDKRPVVPAYSNVSITKRASTSISLQAVDAEQKQYIGVYITALPTKGKLYQRLDNGSRGALINEIFSPYVQKVPIFQYANKVANVSSFWGGSADWSPGRSLGQQDCYIYGDCRFSWCPLTADGYGGFASGSDGKGLAFANNPELLFDQYGYTEYIELTYDTPVYASTLLIGKYVRTYVRADLSYSMKLGCAFIC